MIVNNLTKTIKDNNILNEISFSLSNNDKVGLVGSNGAGKSTLLKVLAGDISIDSGKINTLNKKIGYLKQEIPYTDNDLTILEYLKKETDIEKLESKLHKLENNLTDENMDEYSEILDKFLAIDGYNFEDNTKIILSGLHLNETLDDKIKSLSGGEKIKVLLCELLLKNGDILLLDEPTNNLDIEAIEWLEKYLKNSNKEIIIVSHDETFLNKIVSKIFELSDGKIKEYNLSYKEYLIQKELEYNQLKEKYENAKEQKDKLKKKIETAKEWSNKGLSKKANNDNDKIANNFAKEKTNSSNISKLTKALEKLDIPLFDEKDKINFFFTFDNSKGNKDIKLEKLVCGYDTFNTPVVDFNIQFGTRLNITGGNGSGKTTLVKTILGTLNPISGKVIIGNDAKIGYISQDTLNEQFDDSIYEYLTKDKDNIKESKIFILLDKFNISYDDRNKPYSLLSPGQRTRVNLVKLSLDKINILVLDEVTNHLDKEALDLIYELIQKYEGTIISISHNRAYNERLNADFELDIKNGNIKQLSLSKSK